MINYGKSIRVLYFLHLQRDGKKLRGCDFEKAHPIFYIKKVGQKLTTFTQYTLKIHRHAYRGKMKLFFLILIINDIILSCN